MIRSIILAAIVGSATLFGTTVPAEAGRVRVFAGPRRFVVQGSGARFVGRPYYGSRYYARPYYVRPRYVAPVYGYPAYAYPSYGYQTYAYPNYGYGYGYGAYIGGPRFGVGFY